MPFVDKALEILGNIGSNAMNLREFAMHLHHFTPCVGAGLSVEFGYPTWNQFLLAAADKFRIQPSVASFLAEQQFEKAAEAISRHDGFDDFLQEKFDEKMLARPLLKGAVCHLARFSQRFVVTTSIDHVVKASFEDANRPFDQIFSGAQILALSKAIQLKQNVLLKLHGDYNDVDGRIITRSNYANAYGSQDPANINLRNPLPSILAQVLGSGPLLFLGCSLKADCTTRIIAHITKEFQGTIHFALLSESDNTPERVKELYGWNIRPLFFAAGSFEKIEQFLACLVDEVPQVPIRALERETPLLPKAKHPYFVERPREYDEAKQLILNRDRRMTTALSGPAGFGKTTLAHALFADPDIQNAFGGMFWIDVGRTPNILERLGILYKDVSGTSLKTADVSDATAMIAEAIGSRSILLVIDDVWQQTHLNVLLHASPNNKHLITTRAVEILGEKVDLVRVDAMLPDQAVKLLLRGIAVHELSAEDSSRLKDLAGHLGHWPLLLELANGVLKHHWHSDETMAAAIEFVRDEYERRGIKTIDGSDEKRNGAAAKSIMMNLELVEERERTDYNNLAIFPDETAIPSAVAAELWNAGLGSAEDALKRFDSLSLLKYFDDKTFRLPKVFSQYLRHQATSRDEAIWSREMGRDPDADESGPGALHGHLLKHWFNSWEDRCNLPHRYAWRWIGWHAKEADQSELIKELLCDLQWIESKLEHAGLESLVADYDLVRPSEPHRLLQRALMQSSHAISRDHAQLPVQLYARILGVKEPTIKKLCGQIREQLDAKSGCIVPLWPSLAQADSELLRTLDGRGHGVMALALSGNGNTLALGFADGAIKIWDLGTGSEIRTLLGHEDAILSVALSGDGRRLVSASSDNTIKIWDIELRKARTLKAPLNGPKAWTVSSDGCTLIFGFPANTIRVWRLEEGQETGQETYPLIQHEGVAWVALSGDGLTLVSASLDNNIKIWSVVNKCLKHSLRGQARDVTSLALDMDGRTVVSGSSDNTLTVWKLQASGWSNPIMLEGHEGKVTSVALSGDGRSLVSSSLDNTIKVWDLGTDGAIKTYGAMKKLGGHSQEVMSVALNSIARKLVSGCCECIKVWDLWAKRDGPNVRTLQGQAGRVISWMVNRTGPSLVSGAGDNTVKIWDPEMKNPIQRLEGHTDEVTAVVLSEDGRTLVSGSADKTIRVWNLETGRTRWTLVGHTGQVTAVALNTDGSVVVSGSEDSTIKIWNMQTGELIGTLREHTGGVRSVALSANGYTLVSGSTDKTIRIWDLRTDERRMRILLGHDDEVRSVALSRDGYTLVSGSADKTIRIWDLANNDACQSAFFAEASIRCVALSSGNDLSSESGQAFERDQASESDLGAGDASGRVHVFKVRPCQRLPLALRHGASSGAD